MGTMLNMQKSRWADNEEDIALELQRKREKEEKKKQKAKAQKQRELTVAETARHSVANHGAVDEETVNGNSERPSKRRRLSPEPEVPTSSEKPAQANLLRFPAREWGPCRHVDNFEKLNHIEEGSYGWVSRAKETATAEVVALKKLKMDNAHDGFPVTGLREIQTLMACRHANIVTLREVVMGDGLTEY